MHATENRLGRWLRLGANHVLVVMMATMFVSFILQIGVPLRAQQAAWPGPRKSA
jgi:hypothetical protein